MTSVTDPRLLEPFKLKGPAIDRDSSSDDRITMHNSIERAWIKAARTQDFEISTAEVEFFIELRERLEDD